MEKILGLRIGFRKKRITNRKSFQVEDFSSMEEIFQVFKKYAELNLPEKFTSWKDNRTLCIFEIKKDFLSSFDADMKAINSTASIVSNKRKPVNFEIFLYGGLGSEPVTIQNILIGQKGTKSDTIEMHSPEIFLEKGEFVELLKEISKKHKEAINARAGIFPN